MSTTLAIFAALAAASLTAWFAWRIRDAIVIRRDAVAEKRPPAPPVFRNVRLLSDNDDITAALTRAAESERRLIEIGERRYARYRQLSSGY